MDIFGEHAKKDLEASGNEIEVTVGHGEGDTENFSYKGITSVERLSSIANDIYNRKSYTGYDGSFQGWLVPYCCAGYQAELSDPT